MIRFVQHHLWDIREGGLPAMVRKACRLLAIPPCIPAILLVRMLSPFVLIRFAIISSHRIGQFTTHQEVYLCRRHAGLEDHKTIDLFYYSAPVCNDQLKKMWGRRLRVIHFGQYLGRLNGWLPWSGKHVVDMGGPVLADIHDLLARTPPQLSFTPAEEVRGREALRELGIPDCSPFVCFHARDPAYLDAVFPRQNCRSFDFRDSSIHNYLSAAEELVRRGYFAIRMGAIVKEPLNTTNPMILDYATQARTDFLDIYLMAKCRFLLCGSDGISGVPTIFRRPVVYANLVSLGQPTRWGLDDLFIPKKLWRTTEQRFMSFREVLESGAGDFLRTQQYEEAGIVVVENTPEEIAAVAVEMEERLKGNWRAAPEDEDLQRQFWALFRRSKPNVVPGPRLGAEFLRQNRDLLN